MLKPVLMTTAFILVLTSVSFAQQAQSGSQKPVEGSANAPQSQNTRQSAQLVNVNLELTITDQRGDAAAAPKAVTILVSDQQNGRIRSNGPNVMLNVDVRPEIVRDGRIRVTLGLEYLPRPTDSDKTPATTTEGLSVVLDEGKTMLVSQSADPSSDRKVKVELRATIGR